MIEETKNNSTPDALAGVLAQFASAEALVEAAAAVREAGYRRWDCHSPFPIHGLDGAMGTRRTPLPWLVLGAGATGAVVALALQWWTNAFDYPLLVSGKPLFSLPANIPVAFELLVLFAGVAAFAGAILLCGLPRWAHPLLRSSAFRRVTTDGMFLSVEARDPRFDPKATPELLRSLGATSVELCYDSAAGRSVPVGLIWAAAVAAVLATLPPLMIARARAVKSDQPRVHLIQDMDFQPKYKPQTASRLFADGRAMRPPVDGTLAQGDLHSDGHFWRGKQGDAWATSFPMPVTAPLVQRGRQQFNVFCAPCHGLAGMGDGIVSQRALRRPDSAGWSPPLSLHSDEVRKQPVGQIFNTITHGIRKMPGYAAQIPPEDRWAIVLYVLALQRSQNAPLEDVPEGIRSQLR